MNNRTGYAEGPTLAEVARDIKDELKEFIQTRSQMFKAEMKEKISNWKTGAVLAAIGLVFLSTAYLFLSLALVGLVVWRPGEARMRGFLVF